MVKLLNGTINEQRYVNLMETANVFNSDEAADCEGEQNPKMVTCLFHILAFFPHYHQNKTKPADCYRNPFSTRELGNVGASRSLNRPQADN